MRKVKFWTSEELAMVKAIPLNGSPKKHIAAIAQKTGRTYGAVEFKFYTHKRHALELETKKSKNRIYTKEMIKELIDLPEGVKLIHHITSFADKHNVSFNGARTKYYKSGGKRTKVILSKMSQEEIDTLLNIPEDVKQVDHFIDLAEKWGANIRSIEARYRFWKAKKDVDEDKEIVLGKPEIIPLNSMSTGNTRPIKIDGMTFEFPDNTVKVGEINFSW